MYEPIKAHGFLEQRSKPLFGTGNCHVGCLTRVKDGVYAFHEYLVHDDLGQYLLFFMADRPDANCYSRESKWNIPFNPTWNYPTQDDQRRCLTYRLSDKPTAKYAIRENGSTVAAVWGLYPLRRTARQVVRTSDGTVVSEEVYYVFYSRLQGDNFGHVASWDSFFERALPPAEGKWQPPT